MNIDAILEVNPKPVSLRMILDCDTIYVFKIKFCGNLLNFFKCSQHTKNKSHKFYLGKQFITIHLILAQNEQNDSTKQWVKIFKSRVNVSTYNQLNCKRYASNLASNMCDSMSSHRYFVFELYFSVENSTFIHTVDIICVEKFLKNCNSIKLLKIERKRNMFSSKMKIFY